MSKTKRRSKKHAPALSLAGLVLALAIGVVSSVALHQAGGAIEGIGHAQLLGSQNSIWSARRDAYLSKFFSSIRVPSQERSLAARFSAAEEQLFEDLETIPEQVTPAVSCDYTEPENGPVYKAEWVQDKVEVRAQPGGAFTTTLMLKNTGNVPWFGDSSNCPHSVMRLGTARDRDRASVFFNNFVAYANDDHNWIAENRISLSEGRVEPGEIATFSFTSVAPGTNEVYREYFQPVIAGVTWFEGKEHEARVDIFVGENVENAYDRLHYLNKSGQASSLDPNAAVLVEVDISDQTMKVHLGDAIIREYQVSTGTFKMPTPLGTFSILNKQELRTGRAWPHYRMPQWQGFTDRGHGLHALPYLANDGGVFWNEALDHIGRRVSHGCIRILPDDAVDLYELTKVGDTVLVHE